MNRVDQKRDVLRGIFQGAARRRMLPSMTVGAVMTPRPFAVTPEHSAEQLVRLFHEKRFRHLLVAEGTLLVGVISDRDVIRLFGTTGSLESDELRQITAAELMSTDLITIPPTMLLAEAVALMVDHGINCLPVIEGGQIAGILTSTDIFLSLEQLLLSVLPLTEPVESSVL